MSAETSARYRVHLRSAPGMWAHYDGHVDVWASSAAQAELRARNRLKQTTFPERPGWAWITERVEVCG